MSSVWVISHPLNTALQNLLGAAPHPATIVFQFIFKGEDVRRPEGAKYLGQIWLGDIDDITCVVLLYGYQLLSYSRLYFITDIKSEIIIVQNAA